MTTEELNTIVEAVVAELEKNGVDFDYKAEQAKNDDLVFVIRGTAPNYQGVTVTWKGLLDIITSQATQAKTDAETAKNAANAILTQVTSKESNVSTMKSEVSEMKASVESTKSQVEGMKNAVETTKGQVETMKTSIETTKEDVETMKTSVETSKSQVEADKSQVETMKTSIETTKGEVETLKGQAETAQQNAEEARDSAQGYMKSAQQSAETSANNVERLENVDFRQKSPGKVILDVDVTGTMEGFIDGMEQEPNEAIALTLEPDVPTAESHNFGVRGQICIDGNYLYVCVSENEWKKIALLDL